MDWDKVKKKKAQEQSFTVHIQGEFTDEDAFPSL